MKEFLLKFKWFIVGGVATVLLTGGYVAIAAPCFVNGGCTGQSNVPNGSVLYGSTTNQSLNVLPVGASGTVLTIIGNVPGWAPSSGGTAGATVSSTTPFVTVCAGTGNCNFTTDGTNDQVEIQQAINYVDAHNGGTIYIKSGTYNISGTIKVYGNSVIQGAAKGGTVLFMTNGSNTTTLSSAYSASANVTFATIKDLTIDGNSSNNSSGYGIQAYNALGWLIDHLHVKNTPQRGISLEANGPTYYSLDNLIQNNRIENCGTECLLLGAYAPNNHVTNNIIGASASGFAALNVGNDEEQVISNHVETSGKDGIYIQGNNSIIDANIIESSQNNGIYISDGYTGNRVSNNEIKNNGRSGGTYSGIDDLGDETSVLSNHIFDNQGTKTQSYGITEEVNAANSVVMDNNCLDVNQLIKCYNIAPSALSDTSLLAPQAGNIGIGTGTPQSTLSVQGQGNVNPFTVSSSTGATLFNISPAGNASFTGTVILAPTDYLLNVSSSTSGTLFGVQANGNVTVANKLGVGTSAPSYPFQVSNGNALFQPDSTWSSGDVETIFNGDTNSFWQNTFGANTVIQGGGLQLQTVFGTPIIFSPNGANPTTLFSGGDLGFGGVRYTFPTATGTPGQFLGTVSTGTAQTLGWLTPGYYTTACTSGCGFTIGSDASVGINAAIAAANAAGGGTVLIKQGTYTVATNSQLTLLSNVNLIGEGYGTLVNVSTGTTIGLLGNGISNSSISNIRFNDPTPNSDSFGITQYTLLQLSNSHNVLFDHIWVTNSSGFDIFVKSTANSTTSDITIKNSYLYANGHQDIVGGGPSTQGNSTTSNVIITNNLLVHTVGTGLTLNSNVDANCVDLVAVNGLDVGSNTCYGRIVFGTEKYPNITSSIHNNTLYPPLGGTLIAGSIAISGNDTSTSTSQNLIVSDNVLTKGNIYIAGNSNSSLLHALVHHNTLQSAPSTYQSDNANGIYLNYVSYSLVDHNDVTSGNSSATGIRWQNTTYTASDTNRIKGFAVGLDMGFGTGNKTFNDQLNNNTVTEQSGANILYMDDFGKVGIGTTVPTTTLFVQGSTTVNSLTASNCDVLADATGALYCGTNGGSGTASGTAGTIQFSNGSSGFNANQLFNWDNTNKRLGVGTTTPDYLVTLNGITNTGIKVLDTTLNRYALIGMLDHFNASIDSIGGGTTFIKAGGTTSINAFNGGFSTGSLAGTTVLSNIVAIGGTLGVGTSSPPAMIAIVGTTTQDTLYIASSTNAVQLIVKASGRVGINTTTPAFGLSLSGSLGVTGLTTSGATQPNQICQTSNGEFVSDTLAGGCVVSSKRYKDDEGANPYGLDLFLSLPTRSYKFKTDWLGGDITNPNYGGKQVGVYAEDVAKMAPELVTVEVATSSFDGSPAGTVHGLQDFTHWLGPITKAFQDTQKEIKDIQVGKVKRSMEENWQDGLLLLLIGYVVYNEWNKRKKK